METNVIYDEVDYSYYLGPDYLRNRRKIAKTSTLISNHSSWLDVVVLLKTLQPAFTPDKGF